MPERKPAVSIQPHIEVEIWRLQQLAKRIADPSMVQRINRLAEGMLPGQTIWIGGDLFQSFEDAANAPASTAINHTQEDGSGEQDEDV